MDIHYTYGRQNNIVTVQNLERIRDKRQMLTEVRENGEHI
jgi:hypothetical protein